MKIKIFLSVAAIVAATGQLHAQYAPDALRFSQTQYGSTARFKGLAGAQISVGGDLSSLGGNPAGLGLFTRSEFSITPEFNNYTAKSLYLDTRNKASKDQLNLSHAGAVWNFPAYKKQGEDLKEGWLSFSAGIGFNRTNDFGNNIIYSGTNPNNSVADYFAELANEFGDPTTLTEGSLENMAYEDYLIDYDNGYIPVTRFNNKQNRSEIRNGSQSEINFGLGANYSNTFYIGASLNLVNLEYTSDAEYKEIGVADIQFSNVFNAYDYNLSYRQNQVTNGGGINGRIGVIYKPINIVRMGLVFETPTYYSIDDSYSEVLSTRYSPNLPTPPTGNSTQHYDFSYRLRTPAKLSGGGSVFIGNNGFITADIDYVDYSTITFSSSDNRDADVIAENNTAVVNRYKSAVNYRLGGEYRLDRFMLRAGYGVQGNPYKEQNREIKMISGGLGYRFSKFYLDLGYQNITSDMESAPYVLQNGATPLAVTDNSKNNVFLTIGSRF